MSDTAACPAAFFFPLEIPRMFCYREIGKVHPLILYQIWKKGLYSYLVVYTRHPLYLFIPCWLKYQFTRIVNPVLFARKSNVIFFLACYPVTSAFQSCKSFNYISGKTVMSTMLLLMIISNFSQLLLSLLTAYE